MNAQKQIELSRKHRTEDVTTGRQELAWRVFAKFGMKKSIELDHGLADFYRIII